MLVRIVGVDCGARDGDTHMEVETGCRTYVGGALGVGGDQEGVRCGARAIADYGP
jgi:hypothetical protein